MIGYYIAQKESFYSQARYVFQFFSRALGLRFVETNKENLNSDEFRVIVIYGSTIPSSVKKDRPVILISQTQYGEHRVTVSDVKKLQSVGPLKPPSLYSLFHHMLPVLEQSLYRDTRSNQIYISRDSSRIHISVDIPATCFYFLSLANERRTAERDSFGRFQKASSPLGQRIYEYPIVDRYLLLLRNLLISLHPPRSLKSIWPKNHSFAVALSHDVDRIRTWTARKIRRNLRSHNTLSSFPQRLMGVVKSLATTENWRGNFNFITQLESSYDVSSTFFLVAKQRHPLDPGYNLTSSNLKQAFSCINSFGSDIAVHGTIPSASAPGYLEEEIKRLQLHSNRAILGGRQHYLCYSQETLQFWIDCGLKYDSTLGFSDDIGYRCGTTFPFYLHDGNQESPIVELPLILMDTVLFLESKQFLNAQQAWEIVLNALQETRDNHGVLTVNWHNSDLHPVDSLGYSQLYILLMSWAKDNGGWVTSLDKLYEWWSGNGTRPR